MTGTDDDLTRALTGADPARADLPPAKGSIRYNAILEAAMNDEATRDDRSSPSAERLQDGRWWTRRTAFARVAAAAVILGGGIAGVALLTGGPDGGPGIAPANAAEAVKKAAADTAAAQSGVIQTVLSGPFSINDGAQAAFGAEPEYVDGPIVSQTFAWNGDDLSVTAGAGVGPYELRYVDGRFYERGYFVPDRKQWFHYTAFDDGSGYDPGPEAAAEPFVPAEWLADYRSALVGSGLMDLVTSASGLTAAANGDGTTYSGTIEAAELSTTGLGLSGFAFAGQPLDKLRALDPASPVAVDVSVGADGLVRQAKLAYELEGADYTYEATYSRLGSAPAVTAPDPAHTTTTADRPWAFE